MRVGDLVSPIQRTVGVLIRPNVEPIGVYVEEDRIGIVIDVYETVGMCSVVFGTETYDFMTYDLIRCCY